RAGGRRNRRRRAGAPPPRRWRPASARRRAERSKASSWVSWSYADGGSTLDCNVQRRDAGGEVVVVHVAEAALLHHGLQLLLSRVHAGGFGEVAVAGLVARHVPADAQQH